MAFWGLKLEPNKWTPFVPPPEEQLRLHVSQARPATAVPRRARARIDRTAADRRRIDPYYRRRRPRRRASRSSTAPPRLLHRVPAPPRRSRLTSPPTPPPTPPRPPPPSTQATLGDGVPKKGDRVVVKCRAEAEDDEAREAFNIAVIIGGVVETCHLDLIFSGYAEFYVEGELPVHLTGYFLPDDDDD